MRCLLLLLLLLLPSGTMVAQEVHRLTGYIQTPDAPLVSYFVQYTVNGTQVTGYTITDYKEGNRLRASVTGRLSPASELYLEENSSLDEPHSPGQTYYYFTAHLKLAIVNGRQRWSGTFESHKKDGTPGDSGFMTMLDEAPAPPEIPKPQPAPHPVALPIAPPAPKKDTVKKPIPKDTLKPIPKKATPPRPVVIINRPKAVPVPPVAPPPDPNGCLRSYDWKTDSLSFDIWDGWTIDGDVVSLSVGGRQLLDHTKLSEVKQHFSIPLERGVNIIVVSLHEEGFDLPNTPDMTLYDGSQRYDLGISGNKNEVVRICINRKR